MRRVAASPGRPPIFYGWVLVACAFVTMGIAVNSRTAFSLLYPSILDEFGWSRGMTAAIFTTGLLASNAFTPSMGLSPTAMLETPASSSASAQPATASGLVFIPLSGGAIRPALGFISTVRPFTAERSRFSSADLAF